MNGYIITFAFIAFDWLTGITKAIYTGSFQSRVMRQGLFHKLALAFAMCLGWLVDYAQKIVDIGLTAPVGGAVCVYIVTMELMSCLENITQTNPEILPDAIKQIFGNISVPGTKKKNEGGKNE